MLRAIRKSFGSTNLGLVWLYLVIILFFWIVSPDFRKPGTLGNILSGYSHIAIVAVGMTFPLLLGGIDLSVGSMMGMVAMVIFDAVLLFRLPGWTAILIALLTGALAGLINAWLINRLKIQPFIATLATLVAYRGVTYAISGRQINPELTVVAIKDSMVQALDGSIMFRTADRALWQIPYAFLYLVVIVVVTMVLLRKTKLGIDFYAVGGNQTAARLAGISISRTTLVGYAMSGLCTAIAALILTSRMRSTQEGLGQSLELSAIAAAIIGGVSLNGGVGSTFGAALGAFMIGTLSTGLTLIGVTGYAPQVVIGIILLIAVGYDRLLAGRRVRKWLRRQYGQQFAHQLANVDEIAPQGASND
jgi:ribose/xylose/arabinose/galactoside ABC-type transport system permease subunit